MRALLEAIRFLTIIPIPWLKTPLADGEAFNRVITRAMGWFPLVGLMIGAISLAAAALGQLFWGEPIRGAFAMIAGAIITSGLHLDGLSDTFDATMSWRSRERMLEIMKDSRIGAMGAMALVAVMLLKAFFVLFAGRNWWVMILLAPVLGRWIDLYAIVHYPPARDGGLGRSFHELLSRRTWWTATAAMVFLVCAVSALGPLSTPDGFGWPAAGEAVLRGLLAVLTVWLVARWLCRRWVRQLGGLTGDTYGAISEIGEVVALATLSAVAALG